MSATAPSLPTTAVSRRPIRDRVVRIGPLSARLHARSVFVSLVLTAAVLGVGIATLTTGDYKIAPLDVLRTIAGQGRPEHEFIVMDLRLPRLLTAIAVGAAFGVSGAIFQSISRNPLGSPDVVGFTSGAATGASITIIVIGGTATQVALGAVVGGVGASIAVYLLAYRNGVAGFRLILVGIGIAFMLEAVNSYLITRTTLEQATAAQVWLIGSLNGRTWGQVQMVAVALLILMPIALIWGRRLTTMELGDDAAKAMGLTTERSRLVLVLVSVGLAAVATAASGPIDFVALAAPQLARRLTRGSGAGLVPAALMGALLVVASDLAGQRLFAPTQLPVGVATSAVGGAYLAWLLAREWRKTRV